MLFRRVSEHVKTQNWFAVVIDFVIVVVGVFIGLQVTNWNESRLTSAQKQGYLLRLADDIRTTIAHLETRKAYTLIAKQKSEEFALALNGANNEELLSAVKGHFRRGVYLPDFKLTTATYHDLSTSGQLSILDNPTLISALTALHLEYKNSQENYAVNTDWVLPFDSKLIMQFDWLRYDDLTEHVFPKKENAQLAQEILANRDDLLRHAAAHVWFKEVIDKDYTNAIEKSEQVLEMILQESAR